MMHDHIGFKMQVLYKKLSVHARILSVNLYINCLCLDRLHQKVHKLSHRQMQRERTSLEVRFSIQYTGHVDDTVRWLAVQKTVQLWTVSAFKPLLRIYHMTFHGHTETFLTPPCRRSLTLTEPVSRYSDFNVYCCDCEYVMVRFLQSHYACDNCACSSTSTPLDVTIPWVIVGSACCLYLIISYLIVLEVMFLFLYWK